MRAVCGLLLGGCILCKRVSWVGRLMACPSPFLWCFEKFTFRDSPACRCFWVLLVEPQLEGKKGGSLLAKATGMSRDSARVGPRAQMLSQRPCFPLFGWAFPAVFISGNDGFWQLKAYSALTVSDLTITSVSFLRLQGKAQGRISSAGLQSLPNPVSPAGKGSLAGQVWITAFTAVEQVERRAPQRDTGKTKRKEKIGFLC